MKKLAVVVVLIMLSASSLFSQAIVSGTVKKWTNRPPGTPPNVTVNPPVLVPEPNAEVFIDCTTESGFTSTIILTTGSNGVYGHFFTADEVNNISSIVVRHKNQQVGVNPFFESVIIDFICGNGPNPPRID